MFPLLSLSFLFACTKAKGQWTNKTVKKSRIKTTSSRLGMFWMFVCLDVCLDVCLFVCLFVLVVIGTSDEGKQVNQ